MNGLPDDVMAYVMAYTPASFIFVILVYTSRGFGEDVGGGCEWWRTALPRRNGRV